MTHGHKKELTEGLRGYILALWDEGNKYRDIAKKAGVSLTAAYNTVARAKNHRTLSSLPRSGRPSKLSARTRHLILRTLRSHRFEPYTSIAKRIGSVTARQVRSVAYKAGYRRRVPRRKPFIDHPTAIKRLNWARSNRFQNWNSLVWTDEAKIESGGGRKHLLVTRRPEEADLTSCIIPTFRNTRKSIMVWGCISHGYKGPLILLKTEPKVMTSSGRQKGGGLSSQGYADQILSGPLKEFLEYMKKEKGLEMLVVEDGAPPHRGKAAQKARELHGIHRLPHPPNSPDLNPIEQIWILLKRRVDSLLGFRSTPEAIWEAAQKAWESITIEEINMHTGKMNARVAAVAAAKGLHTKF
jgi:transposase